MHLTYLFAPGDSPRKMEKALAGEAGAVIIDLEDAVAARDKAAARRNVRDLLGDASREPLPKPVLVRCNAAGTDEFEQDLELVRAAGLETIMLAKCASGEDIRAVTSRLPAVEILPLIESVAGVANLPAIAAAGDRVRRVAFGSVDYALDLGVDWSRQGEERRYAMGRLVFESRALGLEPPVDAVFPLLDDPEGFLADIRLGKQMGFHGKLVIHPRQIPPVQEAYSISPDEKSWCERVVSVFEAAESPGAIDLDGVFIDLPVYTRALRKLGGTSR